ncbi:MAG: insulinase family protein, partial [Proteobacteria bacterium]|nr:insulinase family protein [Pseudomonadota bacterium]
MKHLLQILFAALLLPVNSAFAEEGELNIEPAKSATPKKPSMKINVPPYALQNKDFNFPSGLRIVMQADHSQPIVAVTAYVDRGSKDDPVGKEGIAHFVEHLWFRSEHGDLPKVWNILADMGTSLNASTGDDYTNYMTVAPAEALPALLRLESLRITGAVDNVTEEAVDTEREVIRNELRMRKENGFMGALPYLYQKLYAPEHPYARGGIGTHESLNNIKLEDIQAFVKENYRPEYTTIAIVGDFDPEQAGNLIFENISPHLIHPRMTSEHIQRFISSKVPEGVEPDPDNPDHFVLWAIDPDTNEPLELRDPIVRIPQDEEPPEPTPAFDTSVGTYQAPVEGPTVVVAWSVPGAYRGSYDQTMGAASYLASTMINMHFWDVYEVWHDEPVLPGDWGPIDGGCFFWASQVDSKIICMLRVKKEEDAERMGVKILDQMPMLWNPEFREVYLEQSFSLAKMQNLSSILNNIDLVADLYGRSQQLAQHVHYTGSVQMASDSMNQVMQLEATVVGQFASQYMRRERAAMVVLTPIPEEERILDSSDSDYHGAQGGDDAVDSAINPNDITPELVKESMVIPPVEDIVDYTLSN